MPSRRVILDKINQLRAVMPDDEIFIVVEGRPYLSPKAARRLEAMERKDQEAWRDEHREEARKAAAHMIAECADDLVRPILTTPPRCGCDWKPAEMIESDAA